MSIIKPKIIEIGTSFFMILASGHYDLPDRNPVPETTTAIESGAEISAETAVEASEHYFNADTISVSSIKLTWDIGDVSNYTVMITQIVYDDYIDNVYFDFKSDNLCYVNGLREGTEYQFDILDSKENVLATTFGKTETVDIYYWSYGWWYIRNFYNCFGSGKQIL